MATVTSSRPVTPHKLAEELGVPINTRGGPAESNQPKEIEADIDEAALEAALEAHEADPEYQAPANEIALMRAQKRARAVLAGTDTFTPDQLSRIVAALLLRGEA